MSEFKRIDAAPQHTHPPPHHSQFIMSNFHSFISPLPPLPFIYASNFFLITLLFTSLPCSLFLSLQPFTPTFIPTMNPSYLEVTYRNSYECALHFPVTLMLGYKKIIIIILKRTHSFTQIQVHYSRQNK